jgi:DNA-binding transcriptional ArsR family regulator
MMRHRPEIEEPWYLAARALLDIMRIAAKHDQEHGADGPASQVETLLLLWSIYVGQYEGRPLSASKLALYTGMPRPTIMRKLAPLMALGKVERKRRGYCLCETWLKDPYLGELIGQVLAILRVVGAKLTILDTKPLDTAI